MSPKDPAPKEPMKEKCIVEGCNRIACCEIPYGSPISGNVLCRAHAIRALILHPFSWVVLLLFAGIFFLIRWLSGTR